MHQKMYNRLFTDIREALSLKEDKLAVIGQYLIENSYKKGNQLLHKGDLSDKTYYVLSGVLREYYIADGDEVTIQLATEGHFLYSSSSYFQEIGSECFIEAIENTKIAYIHRYNIEKLFEAIPELYKLVAKVHQRTLIDSHNRHIVTGIKDTKARIACFKRLFPHLVTRIAQKYIASFINLTPQTYSKCKS